MNLEVDQDEHLNKLQVCSSRSEKNLDGQPGSYSSFGVKKLQLTTHKNLR